MQCMVSMALVYYCILQADVAMGMQGCHGSDLKTLVSAHAASCCHWKGSWLRMDKLFPSPVTQNQMILPITPVYTWISSIASHEKCH